MAASGGHPEHHADRRPDHGRRLRVTTTAWARVRAASRLCDTSPGARTHPDRRVEVPDDDPAGTI
jgi:hypothetical protein